MEEGRAQRPARFGIEITRGATQSRRQAMRREFFVLKIVGDAVRPSGFCDTLP
ncbi:MAG: hypothetical protein ABUS79_13310 [Pseudomonadota bacterium]